MVLFICEKPSQARDIGQILGAVRRRQGFLEGHGRQVTWCVGHLLEMAEPHHYRPEWKLWSLAGLPILPGRWQLAVRPAVAGQFQVIATLLRQADEVVIATDADREGETIGREILTQCHYQGRVSRLWLSALDDDSIRKALQAIQPGDKSLPLYLAGLGRARADWLVGMNLSRAYTLLGRQMGYQGVLTVGRVQTPTLKLVVDRDRLIENFKPVPYFELLVKLAVLHGSFQAKWVPGKGVADEEGRCLDRAVAERVSQQVAGAGGVIQKAETKRIKESPPLPLELSTLQQEASRRWGMTAARTLDVAQSLYETHKATTYPRTDCRYLPVSQFAEAPRILRVMANNDPGLAGLIGEADPTLRSRAWDDGQITAHHAIIPTGGQVALARLSVDEFRLYDLIRRHYLAQFFPLFEFDRTVIDALVQQETFRASGRVEMVAGWKKVLRQEAKEENTEGEPEPEQNLPKVRKGDPCQVVQTRIEEKRTKPPARYTEGTLIQAMKNVGKGVDNPRLKQILRETAGIGTEATRAAILENLLKRQLIRKEGKKNLVSTEAGRMLVDILPHSVTDPATTAVWEQALDDIAHNRGTLEEFEGKSVSWVSRLIANVKARGVAGMPGWPVPAGGGGERPVCPQCQTGRLMERTAKQGKNAGHAFLGCSRYPDCRYTQSK